MSQHPVPEEILIFEPVVSRPELIKREPTTDLGHRIVSATVEEFATKGIVGARVAEIARLAGTTDPAFYRYFHGLRQAALFIMSEYYWKPLNIRVSHYLQVTQDPLGLFEAVVQALIGSSSDDVNRPWLAESKVFQIVVAQMRNPFLLPDSILDREYRAFLEKLTGILTAGQNEGLFQTGVRPDILASLLVTTLHAMLMHRIVCPESTQATEEEIKLVAARLIGRTEKSSG
ncbi:MAG TPA: TetR/AcrR family transcriptional regulator [Acidobacteriota bacterium]|nr:TetR/AcrR family transcriptional regulator [Acidobacteriota bacterium]